MKQKDLKRAYNNVLAQAISTSHQHLFAGNLFGDIFVLRWEFLIWRDFLVINLLFLKDQGIGQGFRGATGQTEDLPAG